MKIHFMAAVDGDKQDYQKIVEILESLGAQILTKHAISRNITDVVNESEEESELAAKKLQKWIKSADIIIFEVTKSDVSIGYEVAIALQSGKPVIVLYKSGTGSIPHGLKGINSDRLQVSSYNYQTLKELLTVSIEYAQEQADTRFNFFVSPKHIAYLDWIAQKRKIPRSVFLRKLIEKEMEKDEEYLK